MTARAHLYTFSLVASIVIVGAAFVFLVGILALLSVSVAWVVTTWLL